MLFLGEDHVWPSLGVVRFLKQGDNKRKKVGSWPILGWAEQTSALGFHILGQW